MTTWDLYCALYCTELTVLGPKCHTAECTEVATARVHWPSGPILACERCTAGWQRIAQRGFCMHLVVEPISYTPVGPRAPDDAMQRFALLELN